MKMNSASPTTTNPAGSQEKNKSSVSSIAAISSSESTTMEDTNDRKRRKTSPPPPIMISQTTGPESLEQRQQNNDVSITEDNESKNTGNNKGVEYNVSRASGGNDMRQWSSGGNNGMDKNPNDPFNRHNMNDYTNSHPRSHHRMGGEIFRHGPHDEQFRSGVGYPYNNNSMMNNHSNTVILPADGSARHSNRPIDNSKQHWPSQHQQPSQHSSGWRGPQQHPNWMDSSVSAQGQHKGGESRYNTGMVPGSHMPQPLMPSDKMWAGNNRNMPGQAPPPGYHNRSEMYGPSGGHPYPQSHNSLPPQQHPMHARIQPYPTGDMNHPRNMGQGGPIMIGGYCQPVGMNDQSRAPPSRQQNQESEKGRGSYKCGRCGVPKKGHICPYQPKLKQRPGEKPPEMKNAAIQAELDEYMILRRLNLEIQGFPESYASVPIPPSTMEMQMQHPMASSPNRVQIHSPPPRSSNNSGRPSRESTPRSGAHSIGVGPETPASSVMYVGGGAGSGAIPPQSSMTPTTTSIPKYGVGGGSGSASSIIPTPSSEGRPDSSSHGMEMRAS